MEMDRSTTRVRGVTIGLLRDEPSHIKGGGGGRAFVFLDYKFFYNFRFLCFVEERKYQILLSLSNVRGLSKMKVSLITQSLPMQTLLSIHLASVYFKS